MYGGGDALSVWPDGQPAPPEGNVVNLRVSGAGDEGIAPTGVQLPS